MLKSLFQKKYFKNFFGAKIVPPENVSEICKINSLGWICQKNSNAEILRQRLRDLVMRLYICFYSTYGKKNKTTAKQSTLLQCGDFVRVRSVDDIKKSFDARNQLRGCVFMQEMYKYCGTTQKVFKRVEKFLNEQDFLIKKCKGIVILDGLFCDGTKRFGSCDRSCFYFWREEWLEKIEPEGNTKIDEINYSC
jgi:hypothetical protein